MDITSAQNPKIRHLMALQQKSQLRRSEGLFVVEGRRELTHCLEAGYEVESLFVNEELRMKNEELASAILSDVVTAVADSCVPIPDLQSPTSSLSVASGQRSGASLFTIPSSLYEKVAYRGSTEGIIAIVKERKTSLSDLSSKLSAHLKPSFGSPKRMERAGDEAPLIVVLEGVEKPGNLGAVLRSADAANADAVIVCDPLTDLYNPNLIRASIGAVFTVPTVVTTSDECISFLRQHGIQILTAQLQDSSLYYDTPMTGPTALVMGTEATGLTQQWREAATAHIRIPMLGQLDSLNVSVSAAILLYEAVRQRKKQ